MKKSPLLLALAPVIICLMYFAYSQALFSQDFSSVLGNIDKMESLMLDTLEQIEQQSKQLENLNETLKLNEEAINEHERLLDENEKRFNERGQLLTTLRNQLAEMSQIYKQQSASLERSERNSKFWRTFSMLGIPAAALLSAGITFAVMSN